MADRSVQEIGHSVTRNVCQPHTCAAVLSAWLKKNNKIIFSFLILVAVQMASAAHELLLITMV